MSLSLVLLFALNADARSQRLDPYPDACSIGRVTVGEDPELVRALYKSGGNYHQLGQTLVCIRNLVQRNLGGAEVSIPLAELLLQEVEESIQKGANLKGMAGACWDRTRDLTPQPREEAKALGKTENKFIRGLINPTYACVDGNLSFDFLFLFGVGAKVAPYCRSTDGDIWAEVGLGAALGLEMNPALGSGTIGVRYDKPYNDRWFIEPTWHVEGGVLIPKAGVGPNSYYLGGGILTFGIMARGYLMSPRLPTASVANTLADQMIHKMSKTANPRCPTHAAKQGHNFVRKSEVHSRRSIRKLGARAWGD